MHLVGDLRLALLVSLGLAWPGAASNAPVDCATWLLHDGPVPSDCLPGTTAAGGGSGGSPAAAATAITTTIRPTSGTAAPVIITWLVGRTATSTSVNGKPTTLAPPYWYCSGGPCGAGGGGGGGGGGSSNGVGCVVPLLCGKGGLPGFGGGLPPVSPPSGPPPSGPPSGGGGGGGGGGGNGDGKPSNTPTSTCTPFVTCTNTLAVSTPSGATTATTSTSSACKTVTDHCGKATTFFTTTTMTGQCPLKTKRIDVAKLSASEPKNFAAAPELTKPGGPASTAPSTKSSGHSSEPSCGPNDPVPCLDCPQGCRPCLSKCLKSGPPGRG